MHGSWGLAGPGRRTRPPFALAAAATLATWLALAAPMAAAAALPHPDAATAGDADLAPGSAHPSFEAACSAAGVGYARCFALRRTDVAALSLDQVSPHAAPSGYGPADLQAAYALPSASAGAGETVAVVAAFDLPTAEADMAVYRAQFGLPACTTANGCFHKVDQRGGTSYPASAVGTGWDAEIELDLDMVSAICPNCSVLLVEADDYMVANLGQGVDTAVALGATAIGNSYGANEWSDEVYLDADYSHPGVAITASTGDYGYSGGVQYPASSPYVVAVGGTVLTAAANARGWTETAWSGSGSGCSVYEPKPDWQTDPNCPRRTISDISAVASPSTGVAVYDPNHGGWQVYGGTSVSAPIVAAAYALAGGPAPGTYPAPSLYASSASLWDVVSGNNGSCGGSYLCTAGPGYDGPSGLGTPNGLAALTPAPLNATYVPLTPNRLVDSRPGTRLGLSASLVAGTPVSFQVTDRAPGDTSRNVPAEAVAVTGNLTAVNQTSYGNFSLTSAAPVGAPTTSTINFPRGDTRANGVTVPLGSGGVLWITFSGAGGAQADVIFDVTGYFSGP
jgi:hypothetical protein